MMTPSPLQRTPTNAVAGPRTWSIAVLPGDGIGPEVVAETLRVLRALEPDLNSGRFDFHEYAVGAAEFLRGGEALPDASFEACRAADAVLLGAMGLPSVRRTDGRELTPQIDLRERLQLYAGSRIRQSGRTIQLSTQSGKNYHLKGSELQEDGLQADGGVRMTEHSNMRKGKNK